MTNKKESQGKFDELIKNQFLTNLSNNLIELAEKRLPFEDLVDVFLSNIKDFSINNIQIHIPKLIALGLKIGMDFAGLYKDFERFIEEFNKKLKEEIEKRKDYEMGFI